MKDTLHPDRIVLGVDARSPGRVPSRSYARYTRTFSPRACRSSSPTCDIGVGQDAANAFLATKISFINAMAELCDVADADVIVLADAIGHDARIGRRFLNAGIGFGGGCLPKDIRAFMARAGELGANHALTFLSEVDSINMRRRTKMVELT